MIFCLHAVDVHPHFISIAVGVCNHGDVVLLADEIRRTHVVDRAAVKVIGLATVCILHRLHNRRGAGFIGRVNGAVEVLSTLRVGPVENGRLALVDGEIGVEPVVVCAFLLEGDLVASTFGGNVESAVFDRAGVKLGVVCESKVLIEDDGTVVGGDFQIIYPGLFIDVGVGIGRLAETNFSVAEVDVAAVDLAQRGTVDEQFNS